MIENYTLNWPIQNTYAGVLSLNLGIYQMTCKIDAYHSIMQTRLKFSMINTLQAITVKSLI